MFIDFMYINISNLLIKQREINQQNTEKEREKEKKIYVLKKVPGYYY